MGGSTFLTNMKIAFSGLTLILLRMTYTNWPTVRSAGTRYLIYKATAFTYRGEWTCRCRHLRRQISACWKSHEGTAKAYFFLSMSGMSLFSAFSTMTCPETQRLVPIWDKEADLHPNMCDKNILGISLGFCRGTCHECELPRPVVSLHDKIAKSAYSVSPGRSTETKAGAMKDLPY